MPQSDRGRPVPPASRVSVQSKGSVPPTGPFVRVRGLFHALMIGVENDRNMIARAADLLRKGGLVAFPTETVYGLGANASDANAVARIFEAKQRPFFDPLIVHLASAENLGTVACDVPAITHELAAAFWPGPLTLVLPKGDSVPPIVTAGLDTIGVRVPSHPIAHELISLAGVPIAAPSANRFGQLSPTRAAHVHESLGDAVDLVIDGGATTWGVESTIVDITDDVPTVLRHGAITIEQLREIVRELRVAVGVAEQPTVPGQLASHYAPRIPLHIVREDFGGMPDGAAYLAFEKAPAGNYVAIDVLSSTGNLHEAAARLFDALYRLESSGANVIYAERVPDYGLGRAINDRLTRAGAQNHAK